MIILLAFLCSAAIIAFGLLVRKRASSATSWINEDLDKFYTMLDESPGTQMRQLVLAARSTLRRLRVVTNEKDSLGGLFEERVVSEDYFKRVKEEEEELIVERTLIENEAETLKVGARDQIFGEAGKLAGTEAVSKKKIFDEALFLKKQENLVKDLRERVKA